MNADKAAGSTPIDDSGTALPAELEPTRFFPGTGFSCTPVIMKKVRVTPVTAERAKRPAR